MTTSHPLRCLLPLILLAVPASAQGEGIGGGYGIHLENTGPGSSFSYFGDAVSRVGDINQDGMDDYAVGSWQASPGGLTAAGEVHVYSGADGAQLFHWTGSQSLDHFGSSVSAAGDVNADGIPDILIGAEGEDGPIFTDSGAVYVYSGFDGGLLLHFLGPTSHLHLGTSVSDARDLDGDGFDDILAGGEGELGGVNSGRAFAISGQTGSSIFTWAGTFPESRLGASVSGVRDMDQDGTPDVLIGAPGAEFGFLTNQGAVFAYSGATGALLFRWDGSGNQDRLGLSVSGAQDVNHDGRPEILAGAGTASPGGRSGAGSIYLYSGATGATLHQWDGEEAFDNLGFALAGAGDVNGDQVPDLLLGAPHASPNGNFIAGKAYVASGIDGTILQTWEGQNAGDTLGSALDRAGDLNEDGLENVLVGLSGTNQGRGQVRIYSRDSFLEATTNTISSSAGVLVGFAMDFPDEMAGADYKLLFSLRGSGPTHFGVDIPLTLDRFMLDSYSGILPFRFHGGFQGTLDAEGKAVADFGQLPDDLSAVIGRSLYFSAVANQPGQIPEISSMVLPLEILP